MTVRRVLAVSMLLIALMVTVFPSRAVADVGAYPFCVEVQNELICIH